MRANWAERILLLANRVMLVKQATGNCQRLPKTQIMEQNQSYGLFEPSSIAVMRAVDTLEAFKARLNIALQRTQ